MKKGDADESYSLPIINTPNVVGENVLPVIIPVVDNQQPTFPGTTVKYKS